MSGAAGDPATSKWGWVQTVGGDRLHWAADVPADALLEGDGPVEAVLSCGRVAAVVAPGVLSRLGAYRCRRCCQRTGIREGFGTPVNDQTLRSGGS